jgi:membrane-bound metal-dependent hydrolase YbcI (DUF457 family)
VGVAGLVALERPATTAALLVGGAWLGSLAPDADIAGARIHRRTRLERRSLLARVAGWIIRLPLRLAILLRHRGVTHSLFGCACATALVYLLSPVAAAGLAIGWLAHIAGDACTPGGVALFSPVSRRRAWLLPRRARIPTGSLRELAFTCVLAAALLAIALGLR